MLHLRSLLPRQRNHLSLLRRSFSSSQSENEHIYTPTHWQLRQSLRKIIDKEINPYIDEWEAAGIFPAHQVFKKLGDAGFLGLTKPEKFGGSALDYSYSIAMAEEMGSVKSGGVPMAVGVQTDMATPALAKFGSDEVRNQFLVPTIKGDYVACLGVSEIGAGSDVASIKTRAVKDGSDYVINGGKMWTTSGTQADWMCLLANTSDGKPHMNKTLICLPMKTKGVRIERKLDKLGMRCSDTAEVRFEDVRIPQSFRIGEEGKGFMYQMVQFQEERLFAAANVLLTMERIINDCADYTRQRKIFGKPIIENQVVHFRLGELQTEVEALRSLIYRATDKYVKGGNVVLLASMAKLKAGRLAREIADSCLQYYGGMGFMNETLVTRSMRDLRVVSIGGGADEVMLSIIAKEMNLFKQ